MLQALLPTISPLIAQVISLIPNDNARAQAKEQLEQGIIDSANEIARAQLGINQQEAAHKSLFVAGWRPAIGWICGLAIAWSFVLRPIAEFSFSLAGFDLAMPKINIGELWPVIIGMLGLGGLRTGEKIKHIAREK